MTSKTQRQRMIADWLREHRVGSQEEVVARLSLAGIVATQATVSRDLEDLGAVKVRIPGGATAYAVPEHTKNMLDPRWREIGIAALHATSAPGVYGDHEVTIVTTDFGVRR